MNSEKYGNSRIYSRFFAGLRETGKGVDPCEFSDEESSPLEAAVELCMIEGKKVGKICNP